MRANGAAALAAVFLSMAMTGHAQLPYREQAGVKEFTGELIAKPRTIEDWRREGATLRRATAEVAAARRALQSYELVSYVPQTDDYVVRVPAGATENDVAGVLLATRRFRYVEPNWRVYPIGCPNDPNLSLQWHHNANRLDSCAGWDLATGDPSIVVGYCDTGILVTHEDLLLHRQEAYNAVDQVWESAGGAIGPIHPHGTWVTGCGSGNGDNGVGIAGVGWNLGHRMLRVSNSTSGSASLSALQHAARTSIESGDKVASLSYSGVDAASNLTTASYVKSIGGLMVWAAGNDGRNLTFGDRDADDLIVAGGTNESDGLAGFSAYGIFVDVTAPAVNVVTTGPGSNSSYDTVSGTSFATPLTAGLCALIWSVEPGLSPDDVEAILKAGCEDLGNAGLDDTFGYGRIDLVGALSQIGLAFDYPNGLPATAELTGGTTFDVDVTGIGANPVAGTGVLFVDDGTGWRSVPMADLAAGQYRAEIPGLPGIDCGGTFRFYVAVDGDDGNTYTNPFDAPTDAFTATGDHPGGTATTLVALDFESAAGWTTEEINLTGGAWELGAPVGNGSRGDPTADYDGSGQCGLTENATGNSDVDGGPARVVSPAYDVTGFHDVTVAYARWLTTDNGALDQMVVEVSPDDGTTWTVLETVGNTAGWVRVEHSLGAVIPLTDQFRIRFAVSDDPNDSVTEAAIDAFELIGRTCPLKLDISPETAALGDHVEINTWTGTPGKATVTFVVDVDGIATLVAIDLGLFDPDGYRNLGFDLPNDPLLSGLDVTCLAYGFDLSGKLKATNLQTLSIQ